MLKVYECVSGPKFPVKLFARNQLTRAFEKTDQNLDGLPFETYFVAVLPEFARTYVKLEDPKPDDTRTWNRWPHFVLRKPTIQSVTRQCRAGESSVLSHAR